MHHADTETVEALSNAADTLLAACERTRAARQALRRIDSAQLWALAADRQVLEAQLAPRVDRARTLLSALYRRHGLETPSVEALERVAPDVAHSVGAAVRRLHAAARELRVLDAEHRAVSERALTLVRELSRRLPTRADVYGRGGTAMSTPATTPTTSSAV